MALVQDDQRPPKSSGCAARLRYTLYLGAKSVSQESQSTARIFILLTILVGAGIIAWALLSLQPVQWLGPIVLGICALIADLFPVRLSEEGTVSSSGGSGFCGCYPFSSPSVRFAGSCRYRPQ